MPGRSLSSARSAVTVAVALTVAAVAGSGLGRVGAGPDTTGLATPPASAADAATRSDESFSAAFHHRFAGVDGVRMHYVTGGRGPALVLLHGWPQTWFEWRGVMPALARHHTVYALDLPGLGDSRGAPPSFDKATLARFVSTLMTDRLGVQSFDLVAHDLGAGVGFQVAAQHPDRVRSYVHMDYPLPGPALPAKQYRTFSWHLAFNSQPRLPEQLVDDPEDVRQYLAGFYPQVAYQGSAFGGTRTRSPFSAREIDEYARTYSRPAVLSGGFELYRTLDQDERDNTVAAPVDVPTLVLTAAGSTKNVVSTLTPKLTRIERAVAIPHAGHWLAEENPTAVTHEILEFLDR